MPVKLTANELKNKILAIQEGSAESAKQSYATLKKQIFDYYISDDEFQFEDASLEDIYTELRSYFEYEESFEDAQSLDKLKRLALFLKEMPFQVETVILALDYEKIAELVRKKKAAIFEDIVFWDQIRKLSTVSFNLEKLVELFEEMGSSLDI